MTLIPSKGWVRDKRESLLIVFRPRRRTTAQQREIRHAPEPASQSIIIPQSIIDELFSRSFILHCALSHVAHNIVLPNRREVLPVCLSRDFHNWALTRLNASIHVLLLRTLLIVICFSYEDQPLESLSQRCPFT